MYDIILLKDPGSTTIAGAKRRTAVNVMVMVIGFGLQLLSLIYTNIIAHIYTWNGSEQQDVKRQYGDQ